MKSYYECKRCFHKTSQRNDMARHLNKKKICQRTLESFNINDEDIYKLSMVRIKNNKCDFQEEPHILCSMCNKSFKCNDLERHKEKCSSEDNITNNILNIDNSNNNNYINLNINILRSFSDEWDDSKIDQNLKTILLLADSKYTMTLMKLLENDVNLNVLVDNTGDTGLIYQHNNFEIMSIKDIVNKSMEKIYKQLNKFHTEIENNNQFNIKKSYLAEEKQIIENKYHEYKINSETKNMVTNFIKDIYNKKKDDT